MGEKKGIIKVKGSAQVGACVCVFRRLERFQTGYRRSEHSKKKKEPKEAKD